MLLRLFFQKSIVNLRLGGCLHVSGTGCSGLSAPLEPTGRRALLRGDDGADWGAEDRGVHTLAGQQGLRLHPTGRREPSVGRFLPDDRQQ